MEIKLFKLFCFIFSTNENLYKYGKWFMELAYVPVKNRVILYNPYKGVLSLREQKLIDYSDKRKMLVNYYSIAKDHKYGW